MQGNRGVIQVAAYQEAERVVREMERPVILSHEKPDGDALGSMMGLAHLLRGLGAKPSVQPFGGIPAKYQGLWQDDACEVWDTVEAAAARDAADGVIVVDTCSYQQLSPAAGWLKEWQKPLVVVDHHATRDAMGTIGLFDESAAAAALIVHEWAMACGWTIPPEARDALFVGLGTDTGWFRYANTDGRVFAAANELIGLGADAHRLYRLCYQQEPMSRMRLTGAALASMQTYCDDRLAVLSLTQEMFRASGATQAETEGMVSAPLDVAGVVCAVLLAETNDGVIRVGLRSKSPLQAGDADVDVARVAAQFGGGGHVRAAGCRLKMPLEEAREKLVAVFEQELAAHGG